MPVPVIGLIGYKGSGKDEVANVLVNNYGYVKRPFAGPLKDSLKIIFGLTDDEMNDRVLKEKPLDRWPFKSPRELLQLVGTDMFRTEFPGIWVHAWRHSLIGTELAVVPDVRFHDEAEEIRRLGGTILRVNRPGRVNNDFHLSEMQQRDIQAAYTITNDGDLKDLEVFVDETMTKLRGKVQ